MQFTRIAEHPVGIPGLPDDLEAFPVYRVHCLPTGEERKRELLRLELRSARPRAEAESASQLDNIEPRMRNWLSKSESGQAKTILARLGDLGMEPLYRWCAQGIVMLSVKPPNGPQGPHGPLLGWRLTEPVLEAVQKTKAADLADRTGLNEEARTLAELLHTLPDGTELARVLLETSEPDHLRHVISVTRALVARTDAGIPAQGSETTPWHPVQLLARGLPRDYQLGPERIVGGQAFVIPAQHKSTQIQVAFKRLKVRNPESTARMRREIEAGRLFGAHPHVMPILDADPECGWFVMPLVSANARARAADLRMHGALPAFVRAVCEALQEPHRQGWIHRDLKPENILLLDSRWAVADWGLARRPRGATTEPGRTRTGTGYGTEGFAAPELALDAHRAGPPADIYGLGQIIGSILTGQQPQANIPLLPPNGPWRDLVMRATRLDPVERHQTVSDFIEHLNQLRTVTDWSR